jgi:asparagine synthase (glutamine-hydrolysing)
MSTLHKASDTPFVRAFVRHVGSDHTEVVLDSRELADSSLNSAVLQAYDSPPAGTASLYRLCAVIKRQSTVFRENLPMRSSADIPGFMIPR